MNWEPSSPRSQTWACWRGASRTQPRSRAELTAGGAASWDPPQCLAASGCWVPGGRCSWGERGGGKEPWEHPLPLGTVSPPRDLRWPCPGAQVAAERCSCRWAKHVAPKHVAPGYFQQKAGEEACGRGRAAEAQPQGKLGLSAAPRRAQDPALAAEKHPHPSPNPRPVTARRSRLF